MQRISRRTMIGGSAVAAGGAAALATGQSERGRRWLHSVGVIDGPDATPPEVSAPVSWHTLNSGLAPAAVTWGIYTPPNTEALLVCLHGRNADARFTFDEIRLHEFVAASELPAAVVAVDGGSSSYWHRRRDGRDPLAMVFDELLPAVAEFVPEVPLFLVGWSMGGYGALLGASEHPEAVAGAIASAPALWRSFSEAAPGAFDDESDFRENNLFARVESLRTEAVRLDCGDNDPFAANVRLFAREIPSAVVRVREGFHDPATWRSFVPEQLRFLRDHI